MQPRRIFALAAGVTGLALSVEARQASAGKPAAAVLEALRQPVQRHYLYDGAAHSTPPPAWGTSLTSYTRLGATELDPDTSNTTYSSTWTPPGVTNYQRFVTGGYPHLIGYAHAPGGAKIVTFDMNFCEGNSGGPFGSIDFYYCDAGGGCPSSPNLHFDMGFFGSGCQSIGAYPGSPPTMNNADNLILVDVTFAYLDGSESIGSVGVGYQLQVSPAPLTATFGDVPTSDPAFQYVEALVASGITAGCGGGNYCPDSPLTRRQMAVFIAKALGLSWGGM